MKKIPPTPQILAIAAGIIWFEPAEQALADPVRFMAYAMTYALPEDMRIIRKYVSDDDFREALDRAPPGIIDPRSWAYWNSKMGRYPAPPMPARRFGTESNGTPDAASLRDPEEQRKTRVQAWQRMLEQRPPMDPEEIRRRAAARWRDSFGPGKKS